MSEILKSQKSFESKKWVEAQIEQKEGENTYLGNIEKLEKIFSEMPETQTVDCCRVLNNAFYEEVKKVWYDFNLALQKTVENPVV